MQNDPELDVKILGKISSDFVKVCDQLKEASYQIRKREISKYPIFVLCDTQQPIGMVLIASFEMGNEWHYNASFVEEFQQRELISDEKLEDFIATYKDPEEYCCLFIVDESFTNFVYIPYPED